MNERAAVDRRDPCAPAAAPPAWEGTGAVRLGLRHPSAHIPTAGAGIGRDLREPLGETGFDVFPLFLGGGEFGWTIDQATSFAVLDRHLEHGGNAVHTADSFAGGRSEHIIGRWAASRGVRDDVVIGVRIGGHPDHPGLGSVSLVRAVESSLERLGTDRIDVLYFDASELDHVPLEEALATAGWLVDNGKVRVVGAYGLTANQLVEMRILASAGYPRIPVIDVPYNAMRREDFEGDLRLVARAQGIAVTPSHPLEHGFLTGRHRSRQQVASSTRGSQLVERLNRRGGRVLKVMDRVSDELGVPLAAVAIAWLRAQHDVVAPIANAFAVDHVDELVQGVGVALSRSHIADLQRATA
ncbi:MAG: aldo/keto reductase [Microbacterium sp.]